jgi:hypothetical protein
LTETFLKDSNKVSAIAPAFAGVLHLQIKETEFKATDSLIIKAFGR